MSSFDRNWFCQQRRFLPNNKYGTIEIQRALSPDKSEQSNWYEQGDCIVQSVGNGHQNGSQGILAYTK